MKRYSLIGFLMLALGVFGVAYAQDTACTTVGGAFLINFIDETTGLAALTGDLTGAVRGVILESEPGDDGTLALTLEHAITTEAGDLILTSDQAMLTPVEDNVFLMRQVQTIVGGTGEFAEATGSLQEFGAVDMALGQGVLRYTGEICSSR